MPASRQILFSLLESTRHLRGAHSAHVIKADDFHQETPPGKWSLGCCTFLLRCGDQNRDGRVLLRNIRRQSEGSSGTASILSHDDHEATQGGHEGRSLPQLSTMSTSDASRGGEWGPAPLRILCRTPRTKRECLTSRSPKTRLQRIWEQQFPLHTDPGA